MGEIVKINEDEAKAVDKLLQMDINDLSLADRGKYLWFMAVRRGLDPFTKPFDCIPDGKGKLILFANAGCADQLRQREGISLEVLEEGFLRSGETLRDDVYYVKSKATNKDGRSTINIGAVGVKGLSSESLANALMKCHTKAGRRTTLDLCGLGLPDISELDSIPSIPKVTVTGPKQLNPGIATVSSQAFVEVETVASTEGAAEAPRKFPPTAPPIKLPRS